HAIRSGADVVVTIAGNNKDAPEGSPALLEPIAEDRAAFVQGSRFLKRDASYGAMPRYRRVATRAHPLLFSLVARRWVSESTHGFRAIRTRGLADPHIDLDQPWLDEDELEPYLYLRAIRLGDRTIEAPRAWRRASCACPPCAPRPGHGRPSRTTRSPRSSSRRRRPRTTPLPERRSGAPSTCWSRSRSPGPSRRQRSCARSRSSSAA